MQIQTHHAFLPEPRHTPSPVAIDAAPRSRPTSSPSSIRAKSPLSRRRAPSTTDFPAVVSLAHHQRPKPTVRVPPRTVPRGGGRFLIARRRRHRSQAREARHAGRPLYPAGPTAVREPVLRAPCGLEFRVLVCGPGDYGRRVCVPQEPLARCGVLALVPGLDLLCFLGRRFTRLEPSPCVGGTVSSDACPASAEAYDCEGCDGENDKHACDDDADDGAPGERTGVVVPVGADCVGAAERG